jgi:hypothetical protein
MAEQGPDCVDVFWDVHLDPARDPPTPYRAVFELLGELWGQLHVFKSSVGDDGMLGALLSHLQQQVVGTALVLRIKVSMTDATEQE